MTSVKKNVAVSLLMLFIFFTEACTTKKQVATETQSTLGLESIVAYANVFDTFFIFRGAPVFPAEVPRVAASRPIFPASSSDTIVAHRRASVQMEAVKSSQKDVNTKNTVQTQTSFRRSSRGCPLWKMAAIFAVFLILIPAITQVFRRFF